MLRDLRAVVKKRAVTIRAYVCWSTRMELAGSLRVSSREVRVRSDSFVIPPPAAPDDPAFLLNTGADIIGGKPWRGVEQRRCLLYYIGQFIPDQAPGRRIPFQPKRASIVARITVGKVKTDEYSAPEPAVMNQARANILGTAMPCRPVCFTNNGVILDARRYGFANPI